MSPGLEPAPLRVPTFPSWRWQGWRASTSSCHLHPTNLSMQERGLEHRGAQRDRKTEQGWKQLETGELARGRAFPAATPQTATEPGPQGHGGACASAGPAEQLWAPPGPGVHHAGGVPGFPGVWEQKKNMREGEGDIRGHPGHSQSPTPKRDGAQDERWRWRAARGAGGVRGLGRRDLAPAVPDLSSAESHATRRCQPHPQFLAQIRSPLPIRHAKNSTPHRKPLGPLGWALGHPAVPCVSILRSRVLGLGDHAQGLRLRREGHSLS